MTVTRKIWARTPDGTPIYRYTITTASGASVVLSHYGAAIVAVNVPDKAGRLGDVVLGYGKAEHYFHDGPCFGKCPGRFANRIAKGRFTLDGVTYELPVNNGPNHLHGGPDGFQNQVWESRKHKGAVEFKYVAADGEMGYPGRMVVVAHYEWSDENVLRLTFSARSDKKTVVNLTNH
ncbi:MAG: galactose-1-epimerase, partial [Bacteroidales bacterium]|nr:galactose-1-epimerase [Bacteroidales bacterium]